MSHGAMAVSLGLWKVTSPPQSLDGGNARADGVDANEALLEIEDPRGLDRAIDAEAEHGTCRGGQLVRMNLHRPRSVDCILRSPSPLLMRLHRRL